MSIAAYVFNRKEIKFIINKNFYNLLLEILPNFLKPDEHYKDNKPYTIYSIYFDTDDYRLAYLSYEKDESYRYKIRLRSYYPFDDSNVNCYFEIKKKMGSISNKRRIILSYKKAMEFIEKKHIEEKSQKIAEFETYINKFSKLTPKVLIKYDRIAYEKNGLRITIDENLVSTDCNTGQVYKILNKDEYILEIKSFGGIPLWLMSVLSQNKIYRSSFSKYGNSILEKLKNRGKYA